MSCCACSLNYLQIASYLQVLGVKYYRLFCTFPSITHTWLGGGGGAPGLRTDPLEDEYGAGLALGGVSEGVEFCKERLGLKDVIS